MALAYSEDLRIRSLKLIEEGKKIEEVQELLNINRSTLYRWVSQKKTQGNITPQKNWQKGHSHKVSDLEAFKKFAQENEGLTSIQMAQKWGNITSKTIRKWLHRIGFTRKKRLMDTLKDVKRNDVYIWKS